MDILSNFYKNEDGDRVWWIDDLEHNGRFLFSFDKKKIYNLFEDYPQNLTPKEVIIFDNENPFWKEFFKGNN
ncbi:MAG: hypothetical protein MJ152_04375 [Clostridia bacterium]|nr:hypothetical protein [Clostridia bacterium]